MSRFEDIASSDPATDTEPRVESGADEGLSLLLDELVDLRAYLSQHLATPASLLRPGVQLGLVIRVGALSSSRENHLERPRAHAQPMLLSLASLMGKVLRTAGAATAYAPEALVGAASIALLEIDCLLEKLAEAV